MKRVRSMGPNQCLTLLRSVHSTARYRRCLVPAIVLAFIAGGCIQLPAQTVFEADAGVGYAAVNVPAWVGISPYSWGQTNIAGDFEAFPLHTGPVAFGAEAGYNRFFWYVVPNGYGGYRNATVSAWHISALARIGIIGGLFAEAGLGAQFFSGGVDGSISGRVGYIIAVGKSFAIPIKLRADLVLDSSSDLIPVGLSAGLVYRLAK